MMDDLFLFLLFQEQIKWSLFMIHYSYNWNEKWEKWPLNVEWAGEIIQWCVKGYMWPKTLRGLASGPEAHRQDFSATHSSPEVKAAMVQHVTSSLMLQFTGKPLSHFQTSRDSWSCGKNSRPAAKRPVCLFQVCLSQICQVSDTSGLQVPIYNQKVYFQL